MPKRTLNWSNIMYKLICFLGFIATSACTYAESAHQHGVVVLDIAWSNQQLAIELHSPADNILGFEHEPKNKQQQQSLTNSLLVLKQANTLFALSTEAKCTLSDVQIETPFASEEEHKHNEHEEHEEHEEHTDISALYSYHCLLAQHLKRISLDGLFKHFPNIETVKVQWVTEQKQSAKILNKTDMLIEFKN